MGGSHEPKSPAPRSQHRGGRALPGPLESQRLSRSRRAESGRLWSGGRELESVAFGCSSLHSEPTGLFHRYQQLLVELFVSLIRRNVDPVKAGTGQKGESHCWESLGLGPAARAGQAGQSILGRQLAVCARVRLCGRWGRRRGRPLFPSSEGWEEW